MSYKRKTFDEYHVQGWYNAYYGYEAVYVTENRADAKERLKEYRMNEPVHFRMIKKRIKKEEEIEK